VPKTPYQRLLALEEIGAERKVGLHTNYDQLNPFSLKRTINRLQERLQKMVNEKHKGRPAFVINLIKPVLA
jgi:hypothetical protein